MSMEMKKRLLKRIKELEEERDRLRSENDKFLESQEELKKLIDFYQSAVDKYDKAKNQYLELIVDLKKQKKEFNNDFQKLISRLDKDIK